MARRSQDDVAAGGEARPSVGDRPVPAGGASLTIDPPRPAASLTRDPAQPDPATSDTVSLPPAQQPAYAETIDSGTAPPTPGPRPGEGELRTVALDEYDVEAEYARGGLGRVLLARDRHLGRTVALKEVLRDDAHTVARFVREARITARLQHPGIVPVYEAAHWPTGQIFYAMKLVSGRSLTRVIAGTRELAERLALMPNLVAIADAIAYAHDQRVIHRDLKPDNVLVGAFGETVVIDWGLAKDLTANETEAFEGPFVSGGAGLTIAGAVVGTPAYMPPEQATGKPLDERADVYAIGALIYHALSGRPPYQGDSAEVILSRVETHPPAPLEELDPGIPPDLVAIVRKAMARQPADRYRSAKELADDLRRFQTGQLVSSHHYSRRALFRRWINRHRGPVSVAAVFVVALAATIAASFRQVVGERNVARRERAVAQARSNELTLMQARGALDRDPTTALAWLKAYPMDGADRGEVQDIAAEAMYRGVARHVFEHVQAVESVAVSPDGRTVAASAARSRVVRLWDLETGADRGRVELGAPVVQVRFLRDAPTLVSAGIDGGISLLPLAGLAPSTLLRHGSDLRDLVTAPGNRFVAAAYADGTLHLIDPASHVVRELSGHAGAINSIAVAPDGLWLATAGADGTVRLWEARSGRSQVLRGHTGEVGTVAISPDGRWLASSGVDRSVRLWRLVPSPGLDVDGEPRVFEGRGSSNPGLAFSPDGRWLAAASANRELRLWELATGEERALPGHTGGVFAVAFSPDGKRLASGGVDSHLHLWDLDTGEPEVLVGHGDLIFDLAFAPDGKHIVTASRERTVRVWAIRPRSDRVLRGHEGRAHRVAFSSDGKWLASAGTDGTVRLWSSATGEQRILGRHDGPVTGLAFAPDGHLLASGGYDATVRTWDLASGEERRLRGHRGNVHAFAFSPDGRRLATGDQQGTLMLWDVASGEGQLLVGHTGDVHSLAVSPDGRWLASGSLDRTVRLWDISAGAPSAGRVVCQHGDTVFKVLFSPDGRRLASAGNDRAVRLSALAGGEVRQLDFPGAGCSDISFAPDGRALAVANGGDLVLVDVEAGARRTLSGPPGGFGQIAFAPDGQLIAAFGDDRAVRLWDLASGAVLLGHRNDRALAALAMSRDGQLAAASQDGTVWLGSPDRTTLLPREPPELQRRIQALTTAVVRGNQGLTR